MSTITMQSSGDELLEQMESVRQRLDADVDSVRTSVGNLTDWRHMVRKHPVATAAVAGAIGYLLVPNKRFEQVVDAQTLEKMTDNQRLMVAPAGSVHEQSTLAHKLIAVVGAGVARAAGVYLTNRLKEMSSNSSDNSSGKGF